MEINTIYSKFLECSSVSTDTRKIDNNSLFVALKGENFDANTFVKEALNKGAKYVIIDNKDFYIDERTILVNDSLKTLQELANFHRKELKLPIIGLTGSNGKTTTKELINVVLSKKYKTIATIGNLNNHIGVPLTLLRLTNETEIGIIEMGANHQKEIEFLCSIAEPDFGYITNFGKAHLEGFGGIEGVIKGKSEMYTYLNENKKTVFVNLDDNIQEERTKGINRFTFSQNNPKADVFISSVDANPMVNIKYNVVSIQSNLIGIYNANNINAAISIGKYFKIDDIATKEAIENYIPENNRSQMIQKNSNEIIMDAYNANPSSMTVALENFFQLTKTPKIAILGDMFELGDESFEEHQKIVELVSNHSEVEVNFIGKHFYKTKKESKHIHFFEDFDSFSNTLKGKNFKNSLLLIKGSRGMALERTLDFI
ncbi:UDP-N-acetylmuramoyl-tripeptide--D-alanyl-D-alanine ligase [uncultured Flavobacterium sp.]|uniref:UDP-N-acetylmuramoyl-tripeptide--D-alanyl-D- alanine ligase n=1 Tax=uncultured Flavobacterium sp. TaxID=165435 RepID=UPI0030EB1B83|tara:strand:+ start:76246 stop:77529 length:1284 start_codon:yes stop_codon:yes gene_type:complete